MGRQESVINLDPIDRKKKKGLIGEFLITRWSGGKKIKKMSPFGHYMFCGSQGSGKTQSVVWYAEMLRKKHAKPTMRKKLLRRKITPVVIYSNLGIGKTFDRKGIFNLIDGFDETANEIRIVIIDEIQTYFPRGGSSKETKLLAEQLVGLFSQLRKRNTYILSTAQVYGRLEKSLREQCLFMVDCSITFSNKIKNKFIKGDDIICDELGRWAGDPSRIYIHGLPQNFVETRKIIRI